MKKLHIVLLVVLILAFAAVLTTGIILDNREKSNQRKYYSAEIGGKKYKQKTLTTFLLLGLDKEGYIKKVDSYVNDQQCDFVALLSFDYQKREYSVLQFNRDSMVEIQKLGLGGVKLNEKVVAQIALAHTWGTGLDDSCDNSASCVSNLLYGLDIDYYVSFTMDAVKEVTDFITNETGVPVTFDKDYTDIDPRYVEGETLNLNGEEAFNFIRERIGVEDNTNISRMHRQKLFMNSFLDYINERDEKDDDIDYLELYNTVHKSSYEESLIYTNCPANVMASLFNDIETFTEKTITTPKGTVNYDNKYVEFYIDQDDLDRIAIDLYYNPVNDD